MHELPYNRPDYGFSEGTPFFPCRPTVKHGFHSLQRKADICELAGSAVWLRSLHVPFVLRRGGHTIAGQRAG